MKQIERNDDRELTFALIGFSLIFFLIVVVSKWILPEFGLGT